MNRDEKGKEKSTNYNGETKCLWRGERVAQQEKKRLLANANFVTICEAALRLEGPIGDVATNVKHG